MNIDKAKIKGRERAKRHDIEMLYYLAQKL